MTRFRYTAVTAAGQRVSGTMRCGDRREIVRRLLARDRHPLTVEPDRTTGAVRRRRVGARALAVSTRQLAALLRAGLPLGSALAALSDQCEHARLAAIWSEIEHELRNGGEAFSQVLRRHPQIFGAAYVGMIRAGETSGQLDQVLDSLARHLGASARRRGQVRNAMLYPAFLTLVAGGAMFVLLAFVVPRFETLFASMQQELPAATRALLAAGRFMKRWWPALLIGTAALLAVSICLLRGERARSAADRLALRLPVAGRIVLALELARFCRTLGTLLTGGVPILDALRIAREAIANRHLRETFQHIAAQVSDGRPFAQAAKRTTLLPPTMISLIRTGEETGRLDEMLCELGEIYDDESQRAVTAAVNLLEPALIVVMGLLVGGIVAAVMLPVVRANLMVS